MTIVVVIRQPSVFRPKTPISCAQMAHGLAVLKPCSVFDVGVRSYAGMCKRSSGYFGVPALNSFRWRRGCERRYWLGAMTLAPRCAAACHGQRGSYRIARASAIRSASPVPTIASAWSNPVISPTATAGSAPRISPLGRAALDSSVPLELFCAGVKPPLETCTTLHPRLQLLRKGYGLLDVPAALHPVCARHSDRTGFSAGNAARTASKTSSGNRIRFSSEPPYSSSR